MIYLSVMLAVFLKLTYGFVGFVWVSIAMIVLSFIVGLVRRGERLRNHYNLLYGRNKGWCKQCLTEVGAGHRHNEEHR